MPTLSDADGTPTEVRVKHHFRRNFATGLLILIPLWATLYIVMFVVHLLGGYLSPYLRNLAAWQIGTSAWLGPAELLADVVAFIITVLLIALLGAAVSRVFGRRSVNALNQALGRIPVIREIYTGVRGFSEALFGDKTSFKRVVAVQYPNEQSWRIGFVTSAAEWRIPEGTGPAHLSVFVPVTPNATSGFLLLTRADRVMPLSLSVDEAIKLIVSGGTLTPPRMQTPATE